MKRNIKIFAAMAALFALYLLALHTHWPLGDSGRGLSNLDSILHVAVMFWLMPRWAEWIADWKSK